MKKLTLVLILSCFFFSSNAQSRFHPGLRFNPTFSWFKMQTDDPSITVSNDGLKFGYSYGLMGDYMFADNYGLSTEIRFAQYKGAYEVNLTTNSISAITTQNVKMQYLQIPISLKMKTNEIGYIKYFGQFGFIPSINLRTRVDSTGQVGGGPSKTTEDINMLKFYKPYNIFMLIGGGLEYNLGGSTSILAGLTFENGFVNVTRSKPFEDNVSGFGYVLDARFKVISLNLGVIF